MNSNLLKIAMLSAHSCPVGDLGSKDTGGMSVYIRELSNALGIRGNQVDIYTRIHDPNDPILEELGPHSRLIHLKAGPEAKIDKLKVLEALPEFIRHLERFWKDHRLQYDIIFCHYWVSGLIGEHVQQRWGIPMVIMYHTLGAVKNAVGIGEIEPEIRILSEKESVEKSRRILVPTEREKHNIIKYYSASPNKIGIAPCGVNLDLFRPGDRLSARKKLGISAEKILLFVGRIDPLKGIDQLLVAMTYLRAYKRLRLIIIGGDEYSHREWEKLKRLTGELEIEDTVTFQGMVKHDLLPDYYSAADMCIVPSYYESFGLVALEALACGTPVVATDVGDIRNIIHQGETGYVVTDNSSEKLAKGIEWFLNRPALSDEDLRINRDSLNPFTWTVIAEMVGNELRRALDG